MYGTICFLLFEKIITAKHTFLVDKNIAAKTIETIRTSANVATVALDFGTQLLFGETYASAAIKTVAHIAVDVVVGFLVGKTALVGAAAIAVAVGAAIVVDTIVDIVYDSNFKEKVDSIAPQSLYN